MLNFRLYVGQGLDVGLRRSQNEDAIGYKHPDTWQDYTDKGALFIVADGVGGLSDGILASDRAVRGLLKQYFTEVQPTTISQTLDSVLQSLNSEINRLYESSATTIVACVVRGNDLYVAHIGDSRAYIINTRRVTQLTQDQVQPVPRPDGRIKYKLLNALGYRKTIEVEIQHFSLAQGDRLVLMTDGAIRYVDNNKLFAMSQDYEQPQDFAQALVDYSKEQGGVDNIGVIIVDVEGVLQDETELKDHILKLNQKPIIASPPENTPSTPQLNSTQVASPLPSNSKRNSSPLIIVLLLVIIMGGGALFITQTDILTTISSEANTSLDNPNEITNAAPNTEDDTPVEVIEATPILTIQEGLSINFSDSATTYARIQDDVIAFVIEANRVYEITDSYEADSDTMWYRLYDERNDLYGWIQNTNLPDYYLIP